MYVCVGVCGRVCVWSCVCGRVCVCGRECVVVQPQNPLGLWVIFIPIIHVSPGDVQG